MNNKIQPDRPLKIMTSIYGDDIVAIYDKFQDLFESVFGKSKMSINDCEQMFARVLYLMRVIGGIDPIPNDYDFIEGCKRSEKIKNDRYEFFRTLVLEYIKFKDTTWELSKEVGLTKEEHLALFLFAYEKCNKIA